MLSPKTLFLCTFVWLAVVRACSLSPTSTRDEAEKAIQSGISFLFLTYDEIHVREREVANDPVLKDKYTKCGVLYTAAANGLNGSLNFLKSGNYAKVVPLAATALQQIQTCDNIFTPPGNETRFKTISQQAVGVCTKLLAVVKALA